MAELNQNKSHSDQDAVCKRYFILQINHIQNNCLNVFYKMVVLRV